MTPDTLQKDMAEASTTISNLSDAMTTTEDHTTQAVGGYLWTVEKYVSVAVIVIGIVGSAGNALILYALVAAKQHKKHALIVNQNALDFFSSFFLIFSFALKLLNVRHYGTLGYWLCVIFFSDIFAFWGLIGSVVNLATITIDRYLKVVHHNWSKKWLGPRVTKLAMAIAWLVSIVANTANLMATSTVKDGYCYAWVAYKSFASKAITLFWYVVSFYVVIIVIFIFCYGRILITIRRQAKVMASHSATGAATSQSKTVETNVIKTMVLVSAFYALAWLPTNVYYVYMIFEESLMFMDAYYYAATFLAYTYTSTNPFIYATKFKPVTQVLKDLIPCKNTSGQQHMAGTSTGSGTGAIKLQPVTPERD